MAFGWPGASSWCTARGAVRMATGEPRPDDGGPFWAAADRALASPAWRYREIATNHMIASNRPGDLVRLLLELT
jgi:hypothetical protein